jgi:hypothetical protein
MLSKEGANRLPPEELDASIQSMYIHHDFDRIFHDLQMGRRIGSLADGMLHETKNCLHSGCWCYLLQARAATKHAASWDAMSLSS